LSGSSDGVFIVIDGIDGCGKTLHSRSLCMDLRRMNYDVRYTAEPSQGFIGRFIRQKILLEQKIPPETEVLLFAADRFSHLQREVLPLLKARKIVVSDRYFYASLAYQGAQGVSLDWIRKVNYFAPKPDAAIYLDVPAEVGLSRIRRQRTVLEKLELEKRVRQIYLQLVEEGELSAVDATKPIFKVKKEVLSLALEAIRRKFDKNRFRES